MGHIQRHLSFQLYQSSRISKLVTPPLTAPPPHPLSLPTQQKKPPYKELPLQEVSMT